jgi:hypothetical protein
MFDDQQQQVLDRLVPVASGCGAAVRCWASVLQDAAIPCATTYASAGDFAELWVADNYASQARRALAETC